MTLRLWIAALGLTVLAAPAFAHSAAKKRVDPADSSKIICDSTSCYYRNEDPDLICDSSGCWKPAGDYCKPMHRTKICSDSGCYCK